MSRIILIPAAGKGSRFHQAGLTVPKPLIQVRGRTLLEHTLQSFIFQEDDLLLLAVQRQHCVRDALAASLQDHYPHLSIHWLELESLLPGQLATSAEAIRQLLGLNPTRTNQPLLIHNCDTGFNWNAALGELPGFANMAVFEASGDHWSFGKPDPEDPNRAIAIAEKKRISPLASIGLYGFHSAQSFLHAAEQQLISSGTVNGEHYIAPMLQRALERGETVTLPRVDGVRLYGTPAELCQTFSTTLADLQTENPGSFNTN